MNDPTVKGLTAGEVGVELRGIVRDFGAVRALDGAHLTALSGEVHALLGENGAGKSTLAHVLAGELVPDEGSIHLFGETVRFRSPRDAVRASVGIVRQHFKLVGALTGLENIALGALNGMRRLDYAVVRDRALHVASSTGMSLELDRPVEELSVGARQRIEIVKLLYSDPKILVLDEPTAVLAPDEILDLFATLRTLAAEGRVVIMIAHKLDEVLGVADRVTVLRQGRTVLWDERAAVDANMLAQAMVGTDVPAALTRSPGSRGPAVARVVIADGTVCFEVHRGEILGVAGVDGNGQRELALTLAGLEPPESGTVELPDRIGFIPQDRSREGVIGDFTLSQNVALGFRDTPVFRSGPLVRWQDVRTRTAELIARYDVRTDSPASLARTLSGGNQQKLIVAREIDRNPDLMVAENPTRGLDIAATRFVRSELLALREAAHAPGIVLISTDLDEVIELADRIVVLVRGQFVDVPVHSRTREGVGRLMLSAVE